ncbi:MAG: ABC transporter permease [Acidimicrobiia bacterium]|nr:ABC transporter permease [Acidimicrobiia bacterium]MDH5293366.1 ABC transporter permease [Acidimicrobiia bacterium]
MSERTKSMAAFLTSLVVLSGAWEGISRAGLINPLVLPAPSAIAQSVWFYITNLFSPISYWTDTWLTLYEIVLGYALGVGGALVLGALVAEFATVRRVVIPYMVALNATPKIALAPLFVVWFGFGAAPKVIMSAFICFFPVLINTITGLNAAAEDELELMASLRASRWETFRRLKLFTALPYIFAALRTAMAFAVVGAIIGEFAGAQRGLGFQIEFSAARLETANLFAFLVVLSLLAYALYTVVEWAERRIVFWTASQRAGALANRM